MAEPRHVTVKVPENGHQPATDPERYLGLPTPPKPLVEDGGPQEADFSDAEPGETVSLELNMADYVFGQDKATRKRVAVCEVPRLHVPKLVYDDKADSWQPVRAQPFTREHPWELEPLNWRMHGLGPEDFKAAATASTQPVLNNAGMVVRQDRDEAMYNAVVIWLATVPEDRKKPGYWGDKAMWAKYQVGNGPELIKTILLMGELINALAVVLHMSQFSRGQEELLGNSLEMVAAS